MTTFFRRMKPMLVAFSIIAVAILTGCGGGGGGGSGGSSSDWYYHWSCNGDSQCLATNPTGNPSGTLNEGPVYAACSGLLTFAAHFWGATATNSCDQSSAPPPPGLRSIFVTPANKVLPLGSTQQYTATATYSDGTSADVTTKVTWQAGTAGGIKCIGCPPPVATISAGGLATASATGNITITATMGVISGGTMLTVTAASLVSITVTPANRTINQYLTQQFTATGHYSDGTSQVLSSPGWTSGTLATATINSTGLATAVAAGTSTITATVGSISGNTLLTVSPAVLQSIAVTPSNPVLSTGVSLQLTAVGTFSNGIVRDITTQVTWFSAASAVATVSSGGLATGLTQGSSLVTATLAGVTGNTTVLVKMSVLQSIAVTPANPRVETGFTTQLTATGTYSDGSTQNITPQVTWTSGTLANATVNGSGLVTGIAAGTSVVRASFNGISGSTTITVVTLGSSWAPVTSGAGGGSGTTNALMGITWTGSQFVTVGALGTIMTSPDGINWTARTSGTNANLNAVIWTGTQVVAAGTSGSILTSPDGIAWTSRNSGTTLSLNALTWTGTQIVIVGDTGTVLTSPDSIRWTLRPSANLSGYTSWNENLVSVAWNGIRFIDGAIFVNGNFSTVLLISSTDLQNWAAINGAQYGISYGLLWAGTQFVVAQSGGLINTSLDGVTWVSQTSGTTTSLRAVAWSGSQYVIVGDAGTVITSPDAIAWIPRTSGTSNILRGVAWSGTHFVAVGDMGTILVTSP